jgi:hypothetical protein
MAACTYGTVFRAAEGCPGVQSAVAMLTAQALRCGMTQTGEGRIADPGRAPMADKSNDPVAIWQNMIGEMEKGFNAFANKAMESPQFSKVVNQVGGVSAGAQKQLGEMMEKYLVSMNLPSRAQMVGMAERLQTIEGQLNEIKALLHQMKPGAPAGDAPAAVKPARTKRPPPVGGAPK